MRLIQCRASDCDPQRYIDGANECFGSWGDAQTFAWAFRDGAEILFLEDEQGRTLAASGVTYRATTQGLVAIMTGSWTRPEARGRGAFTRFAETTIEIARERNAIALGIGRVENASYRLLAAAGYAMQPAIYATVTFDRAPRLDVLDPDPSLFAHRSGSTFVYTTREWRAQFIERPHANIECLGRAGEWAAIVEHGGEIDRVHTISDFTKLPLLAQGRPLFFYATSQPDRHECLSSTEGFIATKPGVTDWNLENGDRM